MNFRSRQITDHRRGWLIGRPFVERFTLCYRTVVLSRLSVTFVHCGHTVGRIKMKLGMQVGISIGGDPVWVLPRSLVSEKLRVPGLSCGVVCVILSLFCFSRTLTCDRQMTDRQTDRHTTMAHTALAWCCTVKKWTNWKGQGIAKWSGKSQGKWGKVEEKSGEPYSVFAGPWGQTHWIMKWSFSFVCLFL